MDVHGKARGRISWAYWFKRVLYYQVALIYVLTRLIVNISQVSIFFISFLYAFNILKDERLNMFHKLDILFEEDTFRNINKRKLKLHECIEFLTNYQR